MFSIVKTAFFRAFHIEAGNAAFQASTQITWPKCFANLIDLSIDFTVDWGERGTGHLGTFQSAIFTATAPITPVFIIPRIARLMAKFCTGWRLTPDSSTHQAIIGAFARITAVVGWKGFSRDIDPTFYRTDFTKAKIMRASSQVKREQKKEN